MNSENVKNITNQAIEQLIEALKAGKSEALTNYLAARNDSGRAVLDTLEQLVRDQGISLEYSAKNCACQGHVLREEAPSDRIASRTVPSRAANARRHVLRPERALATTWRRKNPGSSQPGFFIWFPDHGDQDRRSNTIVILP